MFGALTAAGWLLLGIAALLVGIGKTALPGVVTLSVAVFAAVLPAKPSTAALLLLLLVGDLIAIRMYFRDADWATMRRLIPSVVVGVVLGAGFLYLADDVSMRRSIGALLLALTALTIILMRRTAITDLFARRSVRGVYGTLGGFTTMAANSGGPVMSLYFLASGFDVKRFLGTQAWFFFVVNVVKVPFSASLNLVTVDVVLIAACLAPVVVIGAVMGRLIANRIDQSTFNAVIIALTIASSLYLLR